MHPVYESLFPISNTQTCCFDVLSPVAPGTTQVAGSMSDLIARALLYASLNAVAPTYGHLETSFGSSSSLGASSSYSPVSSPISYQQGGGLFFPPPRAQESSYEASHDVSRIKYGADAGSLVSLGGNLTQSAKSTGPTAGNYRMPTAFLAPLSSPPIPTRSNLEASFGSSYLLPLAPFSPPSLDHQSRGIPLTRPLQRPEVASYEASRHYQPRAGERDHPRNGDKVTGAYLFVIGAQKPDTLSGPAYQRRGQNAYHQKKDDVHGHVDKPVAYGVLILPTYAPHLGQKAYDAHRTGNSRFYDARSRGRVRSMTGSASLDDRLEGPLGSGIERLAA